MKQIITLQVKNSGYKIVYTIYKEKTDRRTRGNSGKMLTVDVSKYEDAVPTLWTFFFSTVSIYNN